MNNKILKQFVYIMMVLTALSIIYVFDRKTAFDIYSLGDLTAPTKFKSFSKAPEVLVMTWATFFVIIIYVIKRKLDGKKKDSN